MLIQDNFTYIKDLNNPDDINEDLNEILRGEISATEAYIEILEAIGEVSQSYRLKQFKLNHDNAIQFWRRQAKIAGNKPEFDSGIWGSAVELFVKAAKLIGEEAALKAILTGEEMGLGTYERLLNSSRLTPYQKKEIERTFIPRQKRHIESIKAILYME